MADPKTLADKPIADRRGEDMLDRHVPHVIHHPDVAEASEPEPVDDTVDIIEDVGSKD